MSGMDKQNNLVRNIDVKLAKMGDYVYVSPTNQVVQLLTDELVWKNKHFNSPKQCQKKKKMQKNL